MRDEQLDATTKIYIELLDEGSPVWRPTQGIDMGDGAFLVLPTKDYDSSEEKWIFPPGSLVVCEKEVKSNGEIMIAKRLV